MIIHDHTCIYTYWYAGHKQKTRHDTSNKKQPTKTYFMRVYGDHRLDELGPSRRISAVRPGRRTHCDLRWLSSRYHPGHCSDAQSPSWQFPWDPAWYYGMEPDTGRVPGAATSSDCSFCCLHHWNFDVLLNQAATWWNDRQQRVFRTELAAN